MGKASRRKKERRRGALLEDLAARKHVNEATQQYMRKLEDEMIAGFALPVDFHEKAVKNLFDAKGPIVLMHPRRETIGMEMALALAASPQGGILLAQPKESAHNQPKEKS